MNPRPPDPDVEFHWDATNHPEIAARYESITGEKWPVGHLIAGPSGVLISIAPDNRADSVLIENSNIHGQETFERVKPVK